MADLPENPNNREEEYLADLAGQDGTKPNKPWSRKEAYLDAIDGRMDMIDEKIAALATDISLKGGVADYDHLPEDAEIGDAYITEDTGILYVWVGDEWTPLNMQGGGGIKELTTDDYDWPTNNPSGVALWKLSEGFYSAPTSVKIYYNTSNSHIVDNGPVTLCVSSNRGNLVSIISLSASSSYFPAIYITAASSGVDSSSYTASGTYGIAQNILRVADVKDVLSSTSAKAPLSAAQGKALNDKIEGRIIANAGAPTTATVGTVGQLLEDTTNGKLYQCTAIDTTDPNTPVYTWEEVGGGGAGPTVVQTTGTSTTDVMSQDAVTKALFNDYNNPTRVQIAYGASTTGDNGVGIGRFAVSLGARSVAIGGASSNNESNKTKASGVNSVALGTAAQTGIEAGIAIGSHALSNGGAGSVALGAYASTTRGGEINVGTTTTGYGYDSTKYRVIGGVYDGQELHDAATVAQGNTLATSAPTTSTVGVLGQLYTDTTNMHTYQCTAISGDTYTWTQRW